MIQNTLAKAIALAGATLLSFPISTYATPVMLHANGLSQSPKTESAEDFTARLKQIIQLAESKQWQAILKIAGHFTKDDADSLDYILFQSISHDAPVSVVEKLLKQGATLQSHFINILAQKNNVALAKALIPLGLNIHGADMFGRNALHHVLEDFKSKEMFDYLISQGVAIDAKMGNKDPLLISLKRALTHDDALHYINTLLAKDAPITSLHQDLLSQIKMKNPSVYAEIQHKQ